MQGPEHEQAVAVKLLQHALNRRSTAMATTATTHVDQETAFPSTLFIAFELGVNKWKLGCTTGAAQRLSSSMGDG
jgi:hypothetical protein